MTKADEFKSFSAPDKMSLRNPWILGRGIIYHFHLRIATETSDIIKIGKCYRTLKVLSDLVDKKGIPAPGLSAVRPYEPTGPRLPGPDKKGHNRLKQQFLSRKFEIPL